MKANVVRVIAETVGALSFLILPLIIVPAVAPMAVNPPLRPVLTGIVIIHSLIIAYYFWNSYYGIPRLYFAGRGGRYILFTLVILTVIMLAPLADEAFNPFFFASFRYPVLVFLLSILARFMMVTFISFLIASYARLKKAEAEKLRSELAYLKAQVNPHFLFNTLNSIYALAITGSQKTPAAITQLASIMRYVLDESQSEDVSLEKEMASIAAYIELEKLRLNPHVKVRYEVTGSSGQKRVAPLLLLPLVENAFKHGVSTEQDCEVTVRTMISETAMILNVSNTVVNRSKAQRAGGVGLQNVRKRLSLLKGINRLSLSEENGRFDAKLELALT